jgi:hypothetical protein
MDVIYNAQSLLKIAEHVIPDNKEEYDKYLLKTSKIIDSGYFNDIDTEEIEYEEYPITWNRDISYENYNLKKVYVTFNYNIFDNYQLNLKMEPYCITIGGDKIYSPTLFNMLIISAIHDEPILKDNKSKLLIFVIGNKYGISIYGQFTAFNFMKNSRDCDNNCNITGVYIPKMNTSKFSHISSIKTFFGTDAIIGDELIMIYKNATNLFNNDNIYRFGFDLMCKFIILYIPDCDLLSMTIFDEKTELNYNPTIIEIYLYDIKHYMISFMPEVELFEDIKTMYNNNIVYKDGFNIWNNYKFSLEINSFNKLTDTSQFYYTGVGINILRNSECISGMKFSGT